MFCGCELSFGDEPNVHTCPICLAHPGVAAGAQRAGDPATRCRSPLALGCEVAPRSIFHRKNYFYPDNPKAYQISQYDIPLASERAARRRPHPPRPPRGGRGEADPRRRVRADPRLRRLAGRLQPRRHAAGRDRHRARPARRRRRAREWLQLLRTTIRQLGVSDVNMEEGSLRCDANVSVRPAGSDELGTKTELKNMNSFRFLERGIEAELERQRGDPRRRGARSSRRRSTSTRATGALTPLRSKEYAHDYRYFPEPDLVPLAPTEEMLRGGARGAARAARGSGASATRSELGLRRRRGDAARLRRRARRLLRARSPAAADGVEPRVVANWVTGELAAALREAGRGRRRRLEGRARGAGRAGRAWSQAKQISHGSGREVLRDPGRRGRRPGGDRRARGPRRRSRTSASSRRSSSAAIEANPEAAEQVRAGNAKAIGADRRRRDAGDQGPRRRRRGHPPDPREARRRLSRLVASATL